MVKSRLTVSALALSAALLLASPTSEGKEKGFIKLTPTTGWTATMIEGASAADGYCALARQFDQGLVLTLGQSARDEYSLALDFQGQKLNTEKAYKITLQPGPGEIRAYELMPASAQAIVVRLGYDQSFLTSLQKSNQLKVGIDGKSYQFAASDMTKGRAELEQCMAGLKGETTSKTASAFKAEKIENSKFIESAQAKVVETLPEKTQEKEVKKSFSIPAPERVASQTKAIASIVDKTTEPDAIIAPEPIILPAEEAVVEKVKPEVKVKKPIQIARVDSQNVAPKPAMPAVNAPKVEAIVTPDPIIMPAKQAVVEDVKEVVVESPVVVAKAPKVKDKTSSDHPRVSFDPNAQQKLSVRPNAIAAQNKKYGSVSNIVKKPAAVSEPKVVSSKEIEKAAVVEKKEQQEPEAVEIKLADRKVVDEKEPLKPVSKPVEKIVKEVPPEKKETLDPVITPVVEPVAEVPRAPVEVPKEAPKEKAADLKSKKELAEVQETLKALEKENRQLYQEAKKARGEIDTAVAKTSNQALKKMLDYEKKLEAANRDNLALSKEIEELRRTQEDTQLNALSDDPAAQQSMRRYNEAKREIKRLGLLLEQQRLSHRQEKVELEEMLFDPAVTDQAQRRKLADLENRLADAEKRFQVEAQKVNKVDTVSQKKLQELENKLAQAKKKERALLAEEEKVKAEAKKVAAAEVKLAALAQKEQALKVKEQKLLMEAKKLSTAEATLAQARMKEKEIKAAEERLRLESQKSVQAEAKLAEARRKAQELKVAEERVRLQAQKAAQADAKLAEARRKEQQVLAAEQALRAKNREMALAEAKIAAAERRLSEQSKKIAAYSRERVQAKVPQKPPMAVANTAPRTLSPSARNIRSQSPVKVPVPSFGKGNIQSILNRSGLSSVSNVTQQAVGRYAWRAAGMSGKAEVVLNTKGQSLSRFAQNYIAREKKNCRGDFASLPSAVPKGKIGYEIACVEAGKGKSASVVFGQKGRDLIAIMHETTADNMDAAMDARDKIAGKL